MAMPKYNPFKPGSIVHAGMFAGRFEELRILEKALFQTQNGNPTHFLVHGERGIGKSSLLLAVNAFANDSTPSPILGATFKYLTVNIELLPDDQYTDLVLKIARQLQREIDRNETVKKALLGLWDFVTKWKVMGVEYKREATPVEAMLEELAEKFAAIGKELAREGSGIYIFIDEADKPKSGAGLGEFVKVFTERLTRVGVNNVAVGVIGISNVIDKMKASHESSVRIFTPIHLKPLDKADSKKVVNRGLVEANKRNSDKTTITDDALNLIAHSSEGFPYFIQQYAYCAFDHDKDNSIDENDVKEALTKENGALDLLGQRYFENMYTDEIRSDAYRTVLQVMALHMPEPVSRRQIIDESGIKDQTVDNALMALKKRGSAISVGGKVGQVKLPSMSFAAWILAYKMKT